MRLWWSSGLMSHTRSRRRSITCCLFAATFVSISSSCASVSFLIWLSMSVFVPRCSSSYALKTASRSARYFSTSSWASFLACFSLAVFLFRASLIFSAARFSAASSC
ncbi:hypothetical protein PFISCL1PPCAC_8704, partial [Pristionchus fissidentatus]